MMKSVTALAMLASAAVLSFAAGAAPSLPAGSAKPMFLTLPPHDAGVKDTRVNPPAGQVPQWTGGFTDQHGHAISYRMIGADPATSNTTTNVTVWIIPVIMSYGPSNGNMTFNPKKTKWNGKNIIKNVLRSPLCKAGYDFSSGPTHLGVGQYIDEYQRGNFWSHVSTNTNYHTVYDCKKSKQLKPLKIDVPSGQGSVINNPFGSGVVGTMSINNFDVALNNYIVSHSQITPDTLPLFISYDIYLTQGGCCIGGYHSTRSGPPGGQTYSYSTFVDSDGAFSEDISAVSHELGEWQDDPFTNNHVFCNDNSIMENGDPLVPIGEYGTFPIVMGGVTWHPQSLVYIPYFGESTSVSANGWFAFNNDINHRCPGQ